MADDDQNKKKIRNIPPPLILLNNSVKCEFKDILSVTGVVYDKIYTPPRSKIEVSSTNFVGV